mmetsp:Transcript_19216/g.50551  ORF Transcript_19216/g.50551 Transcript_19216/m.50551 type:complete len:427 (-) Transcript_19216:112-1392(-)
MDGRHSRKRPAPAAASSSAKKFAPVGPDLFISCDYGNELPKPPVPKLLRAMPSIESLCRYRPTALELDYRPLLLSERDLLSRIELVDHNAYGEEPPKGSMLPPPPPIDAVLLRDDDVGPEVREAEEKRKVLFERTEASHRQAFGLQLPQLITNDIFTERQKFITGMESTEKKLEREAPGFASVEELAEKIEQTFEVAKEPPVHPSKPSMKPKRILEIVPDAVLWANRYRQVVFDELPGGPVAQRDDLLFRTTPTPRITCFGYFGPEVAGDSTAYKLKENYIWENRSAFTKQADCGEGDAVMMSFPKSEESSTGEARFVMVPTLMRLKKQRASRLDLTLETQALNVATREPSMAEQQEEQKRMNVVLSEEHRREKSEASFDFVDGEWLISMDPKSQSGRSRQEVSVPSPAISRAASPVASPVASPRR